LLQGELLHAGQDFAGFSLIGDGWSKPAKLLCTESDGDGFAVNSARPLITGTALAWFVSFDKAAQSQPAQT